jgi:cytidylate kinase
VAPLRPADDAITIDTSKMDADAVLALAQSHIAAVSGWAIISMIATKTRLEPA